MRRTITDFVVLPVLMFWALMSLGPIAGLMRISDPLNYGVNIAFLITSLWGVLSAALVLRFLMVRGVVIELAQGTIRVRLAIFGAVWCVAYLMFLRTML